LRAGGVSHRRAGTVVAIGLAVLAVAGSSALATTSSRDVFVPRLTMTPLKATFIPKDFATQYTFTATDTNPRAKIKETDWYLTLRLIDEAGAPAPGVPNSGAEYDALCGNAKQPGGTQMYSAPAWRQYGASSAYKWQHLGRSFLWYHGDQGVYATPVGYGCDHEQMGPSGHQGTVSVRIADTAGWVCNASYNGTNDGLGFKPRCEKIGAPTTVATEIKVAILFEEDAIKILRTPEHDPNWRRYISLGEDAIDRAIEKIQQEGLPAGEEAIARLKDAKANDEKALAPKKAAQRIQDLESGIIDKQDAVKLVS